MKLLIAIFLVGGLIDLNTKIFERYGDAELNDYYIFMTFVFCVLVSLLIMLKEDRKFQRKGCTYRCVYRRSQHIYTVFQPEGGRTSAGIHSIPGLQRRCDIGSQCSKLFFVQGKSFKTGEDIYRYGSGSSYFDQYIINTGRRLPLQTGGSHL